MKTCTVRVEGTQNIMGHEIGYDAIVRIVYAPAFVSGPPEDCHPDESEAELHSVVSIPPGFEKVLDSALIEDAAWNKFLNDRGQ